MPPDIPTTIKTVYITEYVLTKGVLVKRVETTCSPDYVMDDIHPMIHYHKPE